MTEMETLRSERSFSTLLRGLQAMREGAGRHRDLGTLRHQGLTLTPGVTLMAKRTYEGSPKDVKSGQGRRPRSWASR